ncbi:MAG: DUF721 domain-containing protein [Epsilonproteobacteria bacterium]|nr:MAG: DUF721 domain-containing protein [Campylobacterota bacterium]
MEPISAVIAALQNKKVFKKLKTQSKLDKLLSLLPPTLKDGVDFFYTKNDILFFALIHQMYKDEFKHNIQMILTLLGQIGFENITSIKYFVTNKAKIEKFKPKMIKYPQYIRQSYGIFDNLAKNRYVFEKFEQIRVLIKEKI